MTRPFRSILDRLEPNLEPVCEHTLHASAAISLKRIADAMTGELSPEDCGRVVAILSHNSTVARTKLALDHLADAGFCIIRKR